MYFRGDWCLEKYKPSETMAHYFVLSFVGFTLALCSAQRGASDVWWFGRLEMNGLRVVSVPKKVVGS